MEDTNSKKDRQPTLGGVVHASQSVVVLVDVISDFRFAGGDKLLEAAERAIPAFQRLKQTAADVGIPALYANDNYGQWRSDRREVVEYCLRPEALGHRFVRAVAPAVDDYFVLKPRHSAFYQTPMELLLDHLGARRLLLAGFDAAMCVLYTAMDAHVRGFEVVVVEDCVLGLDEEARLFALSHVETHMGGRAVSSSDLGGFLAQEHPTEPR